LSRCQTDTQAGRDTPYPACVLCPNLRRDGYCRQGIHRFPFQLIRCLGVYLGRFKVCMAQKLTHRIDLSPRIKGEDREGMPGRMPADTLGYPRPFRPRFKQVIAVIGLNPGEAGK
jgi:hypothetical protein